MAKVNFLARRNVAASGHQDGIVYLAGLGLQVVEVFTQFDHGMGGRG